MLCACHEKGNCQASCIRVVPETTEAPGVSQGKDGTNVYSKQIFLRDILDGLMAKLITDY